MKNRIIIASVLLGILVVVSMAGMAGLYFYHKNITYHITIIEKFFDEDKEPYHKKEIKAKIKLNDQIKVNGGLKDELTFKIKKVSNNSITMKTSEKMSQIKIDLLSIDDEFIIKKNEETIINRLVMDQGISYTIKLER